MKTAATRRSPALVGRSMKTMGLPPAMTMGPGWMPWIIIEGKPEDVRAEAAYAIRHAAPGGGLVLTSGNGIESGVPLANYRAMMQARQDCGRYPIR